MEVWVLLIISIRNKLKDAVEKAEKKIMAIALNPTMSAQMQSSLISDLINKKNMLVNLKVLGDRIEEGLDRDKYLYVKDFVDARENTHEYCLKYRCNPSEFASTALAYANEGADVLRKLRLTVGKMEEDYLSLPLVYMTLMMVKRMLSVVKTKTPGIELAFRHCSSFIPSAL